MSKWINHIPTIGLGAAILAAVIFTALMHRQAQDEATQASLTAMDIQYIQDEKGICFAMVRDRVSKQHISVTPLDCRWIGLEQVMRKPHAAQPE